MQSKLVIITGSARGQGLAMARLFAERGASVLMCDVLDEEGASSAQELADAGHDVRFMYHDVSSSSSWKSFVDQALNWRGRVDTLVNNAGIVKRSNIETYTEADWQHVMNVNLTGAFLGIQIVSAHMKAAGGGTIVNIGSNSSFTGHPDIGYATSKWGMRGLTRSAAMELAVAGIRVNCVCPGLVVTDINRNAPHLENIVAHTPLSRAVEPREVASVVYFLASEESSMITGEEILVDGGFTSGGSFWRIGTDAGFYGAK
ncbi:SDR family NAD(P)-dependent oxidoreductase [Rhizobium leguminosarum]|uniref:SDR family NAD(P)-dependent oxidoreductase n=1 Tax=Rhizobium leguminosarum TaxID=384 RepID=UPI0021BBBDB8|nr:SDR family NAD(P)-dependent oxidoreductase [Rhizobium leguminosarum]